MMTNAKAFLLALAVGAVGFGAGYAWPHKIYQITLSEYQGYMSGYADGQQAAARQPR